MAEWQVLNENGVNYVEVVLNDETVRAESGAMRYIHGPITMESKSGGVGGFLKSKMTGESVFRPSYTGTGKLVLEPALHGFYELQLEDETLILDQGAYWASDGGIEVSAVRNKAASALLSGEGWFQTSVSGEGSVIIATPGDLELIELENDKLVVDGSFAVARSDTLSFSVQKSAKGILGSLTSGEGLVNVLEGTGRVYLAPVPFLHVALRDDLLAAIMTMRRTK